MSEPSVVLVAFEDQPNLGVGYLAATLADQGVNVEILDYRLDHAQLLERIRQLDPLLIGLSIIFQYYTPDFGRLVAYLRAEGVTSLICAGGHYPSLRPAEVLEAIPGLDCIVRFEGELTLLNLVQSLAEGEEWRGLLGLAYRQDGEIVLNPLRPLIDDLDMLPWPMRRGATYECLGTTVTSIVASRGCPQGCAFCSIRRFYAIPPGPLRRVRRAAEVVREMRSLYRDANVRIFLFQDDDFSFLSRRDRRWVRDFLDALEHQGLADTVLWKINTRADEVDSELFAAMKARGLFLVYLGIESGNEVGLRVLNKRITVSQNRAAIAQLKGLGIGYQFGFMLFDPSSTVERVLENIAFLRTVTGDGSAPIPFCKMLPYAGTDIERRLKEEGRLTDDLYHPDYTFLDERVGEWFDYLSQVFVPWSHGNRSLLSHLRWTHFETEVLERLFPETPGLLEHRALVRDLTAWHNEIFCRVVEESAPFFGAEKVSGSHEALRALYRSAEEQRRWLQGRLGEARAEILKRAGISTAWVTAA